MAKRTRDEDLDHQGPSPQSEIRDGPDSGMEQDVESSHYRCGPASIEELWRWTPKLLADLFSRDEVREIGLFENLKAAMARGLLAVTDCSGMGMPEMMLGSVADSLVDHGVDARVQIWRSSDSGRVQRKVALCTAGRGPTPEHVFSDIVEYIPKSTLACVKETLQAYQVQVDAMVNDGCEQRTAVESLHHDMMVSVCKVMKKSQFNLEATAWCCRCDKHCAVHPPAFESRGRTTMAISGTPCVSWSSMGKQHGWMATSLLPFVAWAFTVRAWRPSIIIHECTPTFDDSIFTLIFNDDVDEYDIQSFVFSPEDIGVPLMRNRRWTILVHKTARAPALTCPFSKLGFGNIFSRSLAADGHIFWCAPANTVAEAASSLAKKRKAIENAWDDVALLAVGSQKNLEAYMKLWQEKNPGGEHVIFNVTQKPEFFKSMPCLLPTLLTKTSVLWSTLHERPLLPEEHVAAMGVPFFAEQRSIQERFGIEILMLEGQLTSAEMKLLAGNTMCSTACASVLIFALGSVQL
jgi:hypothetical protein